MKKSFASGIVRSMEPKNTTFPSTYTASDWEDRLYTLWEKSGFFNPDECIKAGITKVDAEPFSIVLPPPNVTGTLHAGHASMLAIEDILIRFKRMSGYRTLWLPGTDHAAIATQSKVEKLLAGEGKTRADLGREAFLKRVEQFAQESHDTIIHQTKKMGSSLDWSREAYTLDEKRTLAVRTAFKKMYDDGIIYRGNRIVNWDPVGQTTISDDEIVYQEETAKLYYLKYGPFEIATARPETKFGDKYVVMHPEDERYQQYAHGDTLTVEWINGPIEATIIKDEMIDREFGTGVMTITPWHSHVDFDLAQKYHLDMEQIIDQSGHLLPIAGEFAGKPISEAREHIIAKLAGKGLVTKIDESYVHQIATAERSGATVEPQIMRQWFINVTKEFPRDGKTVTLKSLMQDAVRQEKIHLLPERFNKTYFNWIDNLRDWCISRQIWFGHQIPVWYRGEEVFCGIEAPEGTGWTQDPDTLDTWFSSGLWTFSTLGWPKTTDDFQTYHPTTVLETGYDILFFWVARMILMSEYFLADIPFKTVYLHGLVRDEQGRKMSKSLGNIIDPLDVIADYGADALRLSLVIGSTPGNDLKLSTEKITSYRNFVNKLWNMGRYVSLSFDAGNVTPKAKNVSDHWILTRLAEVTAEVTAHLDHYNISLASETLRDFTWNEFADWYIEIHKIEKNDAVLAHVFMTLLKLWHPFMPFVTEALFQTFAPNEKNPLMITAWPKADTLATKDDAEQFKLVIKLIQEIRAIRSIYQIEPAKKIAVTVTAGANEITLTQNNGAIFQHLARLSEIHVIATAADTPQNSIIVQAGLLRAYIELADVVDFEKEKKRLLKEKQDKERYITTLETKLQNKNFIERAKPEIIAAEKTKLEEAHKHLSDIDHHLTSLS